MIVARQFTAWDPLGKERRPVRDGVSKSDRTSLSILCGKQSCIFGSYRPSGTGPFFLHSQAVNCLATIILSLRDVGVKRSHESEKLLWCLMGENGKPDL